MFQSLRQNRILEHFVRSFISPLCRATAGENENKERVLRERVYVHSLLCAPSQNNYQR